MVGLFSGDLDLNSNSLQWAKHNYDDDGFRRGNCVGSFDFESDREMCGLAEPFADSTIIS
jgi:hypothetical protein